MSSTANANSAESAMDAFWENVRTILYALALAMLIRFTFAQPFRIPSGSMQPTLEEGDYIVVTKWSYGYGRYSFAPLEGVLPHGRFLGDLPARGDVVVFRPPPDPSRDFVKRLIGMPGDRIRMIDGALYINGEPVERESLGIVPFELPDGSILDVQAYRETLPGDDVSHVVFDRGESTLDNTREYVVPEGHYFMMGDDRDASADSRTPEVEYVPLENFIGPAQFVVASFDGSTSLLKPWTLATGFRGERFLKKVE